MPGQYGASRRGYTLWPDRSIAKGYPHFTPGRIWKKGALKAYIKPDLAPGYKVVNREEVGKNHDTRRSTITEKLARELIVHAYNYLSVGCICPFKCGIKILFLQNFKVKLQVNMHFREEEVSYN